MPHRARGAVRRLACLLLPLTLLLAGCQPAPTPPSASAVPEASPSRPSPDRTAVGERDPDALIAAANAAMGADRMFQPPGENALELYLQALELDPKHRRARAGLVDILPFVLIGLEQRIGAGDLAEAERLLQLFRRADAKHPALPRLDAQLRAELERRADAERARLLAEREAERRAAQAAERAQQPAASLPGQPASQPAPTAAVPQAPMSAPGPAPAAAADPTAASASEPRIAAPEPAPAAHVATPPPRAAAGALPPIVAQYPPRYPPQAQRRRLEGLVEVEFTVRADGSVGEVRVLRSEPQGVFDREAVGAMQRWRFQATGQAITGRRVFDFKLGET